MAKALKKVALVVGAVALVATGVGAAVGGAAFAAATGVSLATVSAIGTFAAIASTALNIIAPTKPKSFMSGQQTSFKLDPQAGIPYPVGRTFLGGNAVHRDTWGADNEYEGFAIAWGGGGPIDAIEEFLYDQSPINFDGAGNAIGGFKDFMWLRSQLGACPSPALASPVAGFPGWGANAKLSGYAASVWVTRFDKKGKKFSAGKGKPGIVGRMVKVYDPRLDSTYPGGSGPCRALQEDTYVWSENPWLHALTWALGRWQNGKKVLGVGMAIFQIAVPSFVDAANIADLNNWKCGGLVSSIDDKNDALQLFAQAGGGQCIKMGAKLTAFVEAPRVSIATIRAEDLSGEIAIAGTQFERSRINGVVPIYRSEAHGWEQVPAAPVRFDTYVAEDGERRTAETEFVLVQQLKQAAELAAYEVLNAREFGPIDTQLKLKWLGIEPGDLVTLDIPEDGLDMQPALALVRGLDWLTGNVAISFRSETPGKHALALGKTTTVPPSPSLTVPDLSVVAAPGALDWAVSAETIEAPDGTAVPIIVARGVTANPNASNTVFEYRPDVAPVGAMPGAPTLGDTATDDTGFEFVYEAGGWKRRWIMQATQDAGVTVQEFAAVTPLTDYEIGVSYVARGVLGERRILGPIATGSQSGFPPTDNSPTAPTELPRGTIWFGPDGHPYRFGSRPWTSNGGEWTSNGSAWLGGGYQDVQDQVAVDALALADAANDAAAAAAADAINAQARIAAIVADGTLDKSEKPDVVQRYNAIIAEQPGIQNNAVYYAITAERAPYDAAVTALTAYLTGLAPAYNDYATDTAIARAAFNTAFETLYDTRQTLLNKIAEEAGRSTATMTLAPAQTILCDYLGVPKSGQLVDRVLINTRKRGNAFVDAVTTWSATFPASVTGTIDTASASSDRGDITITGFDGSAGAAEISITSDYDGIALNGKITLNPVLDPAPPPPPPSGSVPTSAQSYDAQTNATTSYASSGVIIGPVRAPASGQIKLEAIVSFTRDANGQNSAYGKWGSATSGSGPFTDVPAGEVASSYDCYRATLADPPELVNDPGALSVIQTVTGLTSGTDYWFEFRPRKGTTASGSSGANNTFTGLKKATQA